MDLLDELKERGSITDEDFTELAETDEGTCFTSDNVRIHLQGHTGDQWETRAHEPREFLVDAWEEGVPVEVNQNIEGDEIRLFQRDDKPDLLLIAEDVRGYLTVKTVVYASTNEYTTKV